MRTSIPMGRIAGIPIRVHLSFLLVIAWIAWLGWEEGGWRTSAWAAALILLLFACVVLHEVGHSLVAMAFGAKVRSVTLYPVGGVAALESVPRQPFRELAMSLAGPAVNAMIAFALSLWRGDFPSWSETSAFPSNAQELRDALIRANVVLAIFNLVPAFPMDGGRVLRSVLALFLSYPRATSVAAAVGQALAVGILLLGLAVGNPFLALIGVFVFLGAGSEEQYVRIQSHLTGLRAADVMRRRFFCLTPDDTLRRCLELEARIGQSDFPVVWEGRVVGILPKNVWGRALQERDADVPVREVMQKVFVSVNAAAPLEYLYRDLLKMEQSFLPVVEDGRLVGVLTGHDVIRRASPSLAGNVASPFATREAPLDRFMVDLG